MEALRDANGVKLNEITVGGITYIQDSSLTCYTCVAERSTNPFMSPEVYMKKHLICVEDSRSTIGCVDNAFGYRLKEDNDSTSTDKD